MQKPAAAGVGAAAGAPSRGNLPGGRRRPPSAPRQRGAASSASRVGADADALQSMPGRYTVRGVPPRPCRLLTRADAAAGASACPAHWSGAARPIAPYVLQRARRNRVGDEVWGLARGRPTRPSRVAAAPRGGRTGTRWPPLSPASSQHICSGRHPSTTCRLVGRGVPTSWPGPSARDAAPGTGETTGDRHAGRARTRAHPVSARDQAPPTRPPRPCPAARGGPPARAASATVRASEGRAGRGGWPRSHCLLTRPVGGRHKRSSRRGDGGTSIEGTNNQQHTREASTGRRPAPGKRPTRVWPPPVQRTKKKKTER